MSLIVARAVGARDRQIGWPESSDTGASNVSAASVSAGALRQRRGDRCGHPCAGDATVGSGEVPYRQRGRCGQCTVSKDTQPEARIHGNAWIVHTAIDATKVPPDCSAVFRPLHAGSACNV